MIPGTPKFMLGGNNTVDVMRGSDSEVEPTEIVGANTEVLPIVGNETAYAIEGCLTAVVEIVGSVTACARVGGFTLVPLIDGSVIETGPTARLGAKSDVPLMNGSAIVPDAETVGAKSAVPEIVGSETA